MNRFVVLALACLQLALFAAPLEAQTVGQTFLMIDGVVTDANVPTRLHVRGWAIKCNGTILGVHAYARDLGTAAWRGWGRDHTTFHPRPDVAVAAMSTAAGVHRCPHPTEYAGFNVAIDTSVPDPLTRTPWVPGHYEAIVCVEDSTYGRGYLTTCARPVRFQYNGGW